MLNYLTKDYREFISDIKIAQSGQDEQQVVKVLDVSKTNNIVTSKEIWPSAPAQLFLSTNYDNAPDAKVPPDSAYTIPIINTGSPSYTPLQLTVKPYPPHSAWKLECSPNMTLPSSVTKVFYGEQTIIVPLTPPATEEIRWIQAVPACDGYPMDPPRFRFYMTGTGIVTPGGSGTEAAQTTDADYHWTFDSNVSPLTDIAKGISLENYRNPTAALTHLDTSDPVSGHALKGAVYESDGISLVRVGNKSYKRYAAADTEEKYCWYDEATDTSVFTESDSPSADDAAYDSEGNELPDVVSDVYTPNGNYFYAEWEPYADTRAPMTISFCVLPQWFGSILFGKGSFNISNGNAMACTGTNGNWVSMAALDTPGHKVWNSGIERMRADGWCHVAMVWMGWIDSTMLYTSERGYGIECIYTAVVSKNGSHYGYVRDPSKDTEERYAWTFNSTTTSHTQAEDLPTVWTASPDIPLNTWPGGWDAAEGGNTVSVGYGISKYRFRHDTIPPVPNGNDYVTTPYAEDWVNHNKTTYPSMGILLYVYYNGTLRGYAHPDRGVSRPDGSLKITMTPTAQKPAGIEVDDVRIYYRALSASEIADLAAVVGTAASGSTNPATANININSPIRSAKATLYKITVNSTTYYYDPDYTVFKPTDADNKASRFGWTKLSGSGPDHIWTDAMDQGQNTKCYADPDDETVSNSLVVSARTTLNYNEVPLKSHMTSYVIDERTVAVVCDTHDFIENRMRAFFPNIEAINYLNWKGSFNGSRSYLGAGSVNCSVADTHAVYQPMFRDAMDEASNFQVDGQSVSLLGRWWECIGLFHLDPIQFRNCKPGDLWYVAPERKNFWVMNTWHAIGDYAQVAYLRLSTAMTEGSTHTITWLGNSCTVKFSKEQYSAAIKVNQEGYRAWAGRRYAYLGRWLGSAEAYNPLEVLNSNMKFYVTPADSSDPVTDAIYSGVMTLRSAYDGRGGSGLCCDHHNSTGKPIDGENTYELDFSNIATCKKDLITIPSSTGDDGRRFRDKTEDWIDGSITVNSTVYNRDPEHDASCAWAWYNSGATPSRIYTDTSFPTTSDKARIGFDDSSTEYSITAVAQTPRYGWSQERITEADYAKTNTVWTTTETPSSGATVTFRDGTTTTVSSYSANQTTADISGDYQIYIPHVGWSHVFNIGNQGVGHMFYIHSRGMFHQRSGCPDVHRPWTNFEYGWAAHSPIFDGQHTRDSNDAANTSITWKVNPETRDPILTNGAKTPLSTAGSMFGMCGELENYSKHYPLYGVHGGWFDAADFDMREYHLVCIEALSVAYIYFPQNFEDGQLQIPESGDGVPDILSEAIWGAELYRRGQFADGGVGTWFETSGHEKDWPWLSNRRYYRCAGDYFGTTWYVKVVARLAYALRIAGDRAEAAGNASAAKRCRRYADLYTESALHGWDYLEREFSSPWVVKPNDQRTRILLTHMDESFEYLPTISVMDSATQLTLTGAHVLGAASALFMLTKQERFRSWITASKVSALYNKLKSNDNWWYNHIPWELVKGLEDHCPEACTVARNFVVEQANRWMGFQEKHTYRIFFFQPNAKWFDSTGYGLFMPDVRGPLCIAAYLATNNTNYLDALAVAMDHATGCNSLGRTYTTGLGKVSPVRHLDSWLPRASAQGNMWTPRPGISLYSVPTVEYKADAFNIGIGPSIAARSDMQFNKTSFDLFPMVLASKWNASAGTLRNNVIAAHTPMWRTHACFEIEDCYPGTSEYTISENIVWKAAISGMLMGPGWKPKFWYNQVKPASKRHEEPNYVILP